MAVWKYAALSQQEESGQPSALPETVLGAGSNVSSASGGGGPPFADDDIALKRRMPFCIGL